MYVTHCCWCSWCTWGNRVIFSRQCICLVCSFLKTNIRSGIGARSSLSTTLEFFYGETTDVSSIQSNPFGQMVTELITADSGKTKASPKPLKGAMKVIKKLKGRIGLGEFLSRLRFPANGQPFVTNYFFLLSFFFFSSCLSRH